MKITIRTFKEPMDFGEHWVATTSTKPFNGISGFDTSEPGAIKEFCTALIGAIEIEQEDANK